ncbi:MAG: hypothetical protein K1Y36_13300 [Blastocatellia bacterium]|nr:hypothetical protein [Blastocatellia bacterium]
MPATSEDAKLILQLYEMRREETMRKARHFITFCFFPETVEDVRAMLRNMEAPEHGAYFRQVYTYWEMAAALVNHGTINEDLFNECNGEHLAVYAKIEDLLPGLREAFGAHFMSNLEALIQRMPDGASRMARLKENLKSLANQ